MIYILLPTYARVEETKSFIESIYDSINENFMIIIIDDHPENITYRSLRKDINIKIYKPEKELWWVGSINKGIKVLLEDIKILDDDIIIFANNDVIINKKCFLEIINILDEDEIQIVHPRTLDYENNELSSGTKIYSFFPYITMHPKNFVAKKYQIDTGTARFLSFKGIVLKKVGYINNNLLQYGGDNDFTLRATKLFDIKCYILRDAFCRLNDNDTGMKSYNIVTIKELLSSFKSIKSPNNIYFRYEQYRNVYNGFYAFFIVVSLTLNSFLKFIYYSFKRNIL